MAQIIWSQHAADDLDEIAAFIAADKPDAAAKMVAKVLEQVDRLADFPKLGRRVPELESERYRELIVAPCRIIYTCDMERVVVQRVIRGERHIHRGMVP